MPPIVPFPQFQPSMLTPKQLNRTLGTLSLHSGGGSQLFEIVLCMGVIPVTALDNWLAEAGIMNASYTFCASLAAKAAVPQNGILRRTLDAWRSGEILWALHTTRNGHHRPRLWGRIAVLCESTGSAHPLAI